MTSPVRTFVNNRAAQKLRADVARTASVLGLNNQQCFAWLFSVLQASGQVHGATPEFIEGFATLLVNSKYPAALKRLHELHDTDGFAEKLLDQVAPLFNENGTWIKPVRRNPKIDFVSAVHARHEMDWAAGTPQDARLFDELLLRSIRCCLFDGEAGLNISEAVFALRMWVNT